MDRWLPPQIRFIPWTWPSPAHADTLTTRLPERSARQSTPRRRRSPRLAHRADDTVSQLPRRRRAGKLSGYRYSSAICDWAIIVSACWRVAARSRMAACNVADGAPADVDSCSRNGWLPAGRLDLAQPARPWKAAEYAITTTAAPPPAINLGGSDANGQAAPAPAPQVMAASRRP